MMFTFFGTMVIQPLDMYQGPRYTNHIEDVMEHYVLDHIYHLAVDKRDDYINLIADGYVSFKSINSFDGGL